MRNKFIANTGVRKGWRSLAVSILVLQWSVSTAQRPECPEDAYWLRSQAQVSAFPRSCIVITGNLWIGPSDWITDLSALSHISEIRGDLVVVGLGLEHSGYSGALSGLSNLSEVGGDVEIMYNGRMTGIDGLSGVRHVGGDIEIFGNASLRDLDGLSGLTEIGGSVTVTDNAALAACSCGVYACVNGGFIGGHVTMKGNAPSGDCNYDGEDLAPALCPSTVTANEGTALPPAAFALHPAYPNPFNPSTTITYDVPEAAQVRLVVFDALGRAVDDLGTRHSAPGTYSQTWDASNRTSGVYFVRMQAGSFSETRQVILLE